MSHRPHRVSDPPLIVRPAPPDPIAAHVYSTCTVRELPRPVGPDTLAVSGW
jgi:hypothetical protein